VEQATTPVESTQRVSWSVKKYTPPPPPFVPVLSWGCTGSNTWRPARTTRSPYDWRGDTHIFQGDGRISGHMTGNMRGYFFYGTSILGDISAALDAGGTLKYVTVYLYRPQVNGANRNDPVYLSWHKYAAQPARSPRPWLSTPIRIGTLRWQQGKYFRLPSAWHRHLLNQVKKFKAGSLTANESFGLGFYAPSGSPFVQITGFGGDQGPTVPYAVNALPPSHLESGDVSVRHIGDPNSGRISVDYWQGKKWQV
jgi:hypothetical protein